MWKSEWYCRWCGETYRPKKRTDRDGFCSTAHKQAHHRAYNKYVTGKMDPTGSGNDHAAAVTQPTVKKRKSR